MMSVIAVKDASFSYDGKNMIFEHLSFELSSGEIMCLLGPNGIG
ncbi:MAG: ABC transporter ATP-binding protein, partial [Oscillospiraceae bacterium]|nr:ABC transporter ATP-binding protein [Oscillospiraceae bacterium]